MSRVDSGEHQDTHALMTDRKECDQSVNQREVDQGKKNNAEFQRMGLWWYLRMGAVRLPRENMEQ